MNIYSKIEDLRRNPIKSALCVIVSTSGSTPRKEGSKMIVMADKKIYGTIGGGSIELKVIENALEVIKENKPKKFIYKLEEDLKMHCGGACEVYIEPIKKAEKLYIFGAGHIGRMIAKFAVDLEFDVTLIDERPEIYNEFELEGCKKITQKYFEAIENTEFDENSYMVIVTPKHVSDEDILSKVVLKQNAYVGMLGSKRKVEKARKRFLEEKLLTAEQIDSIDMPIGIPLIVETPAEIAISIVAKLVNVRNAKLKFQI